MIQTNRNSSSSTRRLKALVLAEVIVASFASACGGGTPEPADDLITTSLAAVQYQLATTIETGFGYDGNLHLIGLSKAGYPFVAAWQDSGGGWHRGYPLTTKYQLTSLVTGRGANGSFQILGIGTDGLPHVVTWQDGSGWHDGLPFRWAVPPVSAIAAGRGVGGQLQLVGLNRYDGFVYPIGYLDWQGTWQQPPNAIPNQTVPLSSLTLGEGNDGRLQALGLARGRVTLAGSQNPDGSWKAGGPIRAVPSRRGGLAGFDSLVAERGNADFLQVLGVTVDGLYLATWQDNGGQWNDGLALDPDPYQFWYRTAVAREPSGLLLAFGMSADGYLGLADFQDFGGQYHAGFLFPPVMSAPMDLGYVKIGPRPVTITEIKTGKGPHGAVQLFGLGNDGIGNPGAIYVVATLCWTPSHPLQ